MGNDCAFGNTNCLLSCKAFCDVKCTESGNPTTQPTPNPTLTTCAEYSSESSCIQDARCLWGIKPSSVGSTGDNRRILAVGCYNKLSTLTPTKSPETKKQKRKKKRKKKKKKKIRLWILRRKRRR